MKYLVVDDSKLARLTIIKSLKEHVDESKIIQASNGADALELVKTNKINVVFLDLTMPIMDGYEALPKILEINNNINVVNSELFNNNSINIVFTHKNVITILTF